MVDVEKASTPDVKKYLDANMYLKDVYSALKQSNRHFSYEEWAKVLEIPSRSYLRSVIYGKKKISESLAKKIADSLNLNVEAKEYFYLLVRFTQCEEVEQKKLFGRNLINLIKKSVDYTTINPKATILQNPLVMIVRNILSYKDIKRDVDTLVHLTGQSKEMILECIRILFQEGLIEAVGNEWQATQKILKFEDQEQNRALLKFHEESLLKAIASQDIPAKERSYRSITLSLSEQEYLDYLRQQNDFIQSVFSRFDGDFLTERRIYQINFNLIPWTQKYLPEVGEC